MRIRILGAGAGGGLPQWNCGCRNCADARAGALPPMTQSSVAVSPDGASWVLLNASPDIRQQLAATPELHPRGLRDTPVAGVVLTNGDIDHVAGLLTLRERTGFTIWATDAGRAILEGDAVFRVLDPDLVGRRRVVLDAPFEPVPGLNVTAFAVPGKVALFLEDGDDVDTRAMGEQTVGLRLEAGGRVACYVPGCAEVTDDLLGRLAGADLVLFDGTVWQDAEMQATGTGSKTGSRMGHVQMAGPGGSLERLAGIGARRVYVHLNNTNPVLQPDAPERAAVLAAGWEIAFDGQEIAP